MRSAALLAALFLTACGAEEPGATANGAAAPRPGEPDNRIDCRVGNMNGFERICSAERADGGRVLIVRYPNGGFRRLGITRDGRGVIAADGAERANVAILADDRIEVEIGGDRFRLPATVRRQ